MKKYSQEEFDKMLKRHQEWLEHGKNGERLMLKGADLSLLDLEGANLKESYLERCNFTDSNLREVNFSNSYLLGTGFIDSYLEDAYFINAVLNCANFKGTNLRHANFFNADLRYVVFKDTNLVFTDFRAAFLPAGFYQVKGCGSNTRCTTYNAIEDFVVCGCWDDGKGNHLESFKARIEEVYGKDSQRAGKEQYYAEYMAAVSFFEKMRDIVQKEGA